MKDFSQEKKIENQILRKKKRKLKRERLLSILKQKFKFFIYLPLALIIAYLLFYSPFFVIKEIEINELSYVNQGKILADFEVLENENFFLTDLASLRTQVIKEHAFIENIYTEKVFPNKVVVHVREKEPEFVVNNEQGCFLIDKVGFVLLEDGCSDLKTNYSAKEIFGDDLNNIDFVVNTQSNFYNAEKIFEVINVLNHYGYTVKEVNIENQVLKFELYDDRSFIFSFASDLQKQLKRFIVVKKKIDYDNMDFESIDMRFQRPVLKQK